MEYCLKSVDNFLEKKNYPIFEIGCIHMVCIHVCLLKDFH